MQEGRIELLQRMAIFGGIRADILEYLLVLCPIVSVPANEFFFREDEPGDAMFVLEKGRAAVLKSWRKTTPSLPTSSNCMLRLETICRVWATIAPSRIAGCGRECSG